MMMNPLQAIGSAASNAFDFTGRATRSEYWWFFLVYGLALAGALFRDFSIIMTVDQSGSQLPMTTVWVILIMFFPALTIQFRRLHDAGFSGWWLLLNLVPFGNVALLAMACLPSEKWPNKWGQPYGEGRLPGADVFSDAQPDVPEIFKPGNLYGPTKAEAQMPAYERAAMRKAEVSAYYKSRVLSQQSA